jgi:hypothetical protein
VLVLPGHSYRHFLSLYSSAQKNAHERFENLSALVKRSNQHAHLRNSDIYCFTVVRFVRGAPSP